MKKKKLTRRLRLAVNVLLIVVLVFQSASFLLAPNKVVASTEPHGALKRVIVTYRGAPNTPGPSDTPVDTDWIPGVPNAGSQLRTRSIALAAICMTLLLVINIVPVVRRNHRAAR